MAFQQRLEGDEGAIHKDIMGMVSVEGSEKEKERWLVWLGWSEGRQEGEEMRSER